MRGDAARHGQHLAAFDVLALGAPQQHADVLAGPTFVEQFAEHLDTRTGRPLRLADTDDLDLVADLDDAPVNATGDHRAPALDREDVLDGHQERLVHGPFRLGNVVVQGLDEFQHAALADLGRIALERLQCAADHDGGVLGELVLLEDFLDVEGHEFDELLALVLLELVHLVHVDHDARHADLARQQDVLTGLRHGAVDGRHDEDRAIHLGGAGDHVLDVVRVARAVDVGVVPIRALVLDMRRGDGDTTFAFLGRVVDLVELLDLATLARRADLGHRRGQRGLAVVHVSDRADIDVRLGSFESLFGHVEAVSLSSQRLSRAV